MLLKPSFLPGAYYCYRRSENTRYNFRSVRKMVRGGEIVSEYNRVSFIRTDVGMGVDWTRNPGVRVITGV